MAYVPDIGVEPVEVPNCTTTNVTTTCHPYSYYRGVDELTYTNNGRCDG